MDKADIADCLHQINMTACYSHFQPSDIDSKQENTKLFIKQEIHNNDPALCAALYSQKYCLYGM